MRPNQEIHAYMEAVKGIGKDHAKFSPVCMSEILNIYHTNKIF